MKKFVFTFLAIALLIGLGVEDPVDAAPWRFVCVADSIDAETADTFHVYTRSYTKGFRVLGFNRNALSGASDGAWTFQSVITDGKIGSANQYITLLTWREGETAAQDSLSILNRNKMFYLLGFQNIDNEIGELATVIPGKTLRIYWDPNNVTGGFTSLYLWYQIIE